MKYIIVDWIPSERALAVDPIFTEHRNFPLVTSYFTCADDIPDEYIIRTLQQGDHTYPFSECEYLITKNEEFRKMPSWGEAKRFGFKYLWNPNKH